jgi:hypothetical protein
VAPEPPRHKPDQPRPWWPRGWPWRRWRWDRDVESKREAWACRFFAEEIAKDPSLTTKCELEPASPGLRPAAVDREHAEATEELFGAWLAAKVCARRLPTDPIGAGLDALDTVANRSAELVAQVDRIRPFADDRAPDGGRWFPYAMQHPEAGIDPQEAARRDFRSGESGGYVELVDEGVTSFRRSLSRSKQLATVIHYVPLATLAAVLAIAESVLPGGWLIALIIGLAGFILVDSVIVAQIVEPTIESRRRQILDGAADDLFSLGMGAVAAGLSRKWHPPEPPYGPEPS